MASLTAAGCGEPPAHPAVGVRLRGLPITSVDEPSAKPPPLEGSVTLRREGMDDLVVTAGQGIRIAPGLPHSAIAGAQGLRAVSSWIVVNGQPLREALPD